MSKAARYSLILLLLSSTGLANYRREIRQSDSDTKFKPSAPQLLSKDSPTKDEDPSVLRARDGTLFVAWFSDRGGNPDIYISNTRNGIDWAEPVRITTSIDGDFYPNL